jgi:[acyl-carrier-protein] S-malonyltransferase
MSKALLFSGQGSQYVGMMKDLAERYPVANDLIKQADSILGYKLSEICFEGPIETLKETRYTQPALFLHEAVLVSLLEGKIDYSATAGHSVGEYAALFASGVLSFQDALQLVSLRGELMFRAGEIMPGTMFAVIGLDEAKVIELCDTLTKEGNGNVIVPANFNSPGQVVVSGSADYLREKAPLFKEAGAKMVSELVVSGAFHSPLVEPARTELEKRINSIAFNNAKAPIYSNVYAKPLTDAEEIKKALIQQLTSPVLWTQSLKAMQTDGIDTYVEVGPGKVLQGLVKRTLTGVQIEGIDKVGDIEKYL